MDLKYGDIAINKYHTEPFEKWPFTKKDTFIHIEHPEFTALCPRSGYPDFGCIVLDYVPDKWVVELKAWKLYINGFREVRVSHENIINEIADKFENEIAPKGFRLLGDYSRRGNIKTVITIERGADFDYRDYYCNTI